MNEARISRSDQFADSRQGGFALDEHAAQAVLSLGTEATQRRAIYLDMKYWIKLRNASRDKSNTTDHQLLSILRKGIAKGVVFCPISEAVFLEVMKQQDLTSRLATAQLIDELSLGTTLALERERIRTEIEYFMYWAAGRRKQQPMEYWVWRRLGYVLGFVHPELVGLDPAISALLHRVFFKHMHVGSLTTRNEALLKQVWVDAGRTERPSLRSERVHLAHAQPRPSTRFAGPPLRCGPPGDCRD